MPRSTARPVPTSPACRYLADQVELAVAALTQIASLNAYRCELTAPVAVLERLVQLFGLAHRPDLDNAQVLTIAGEPVHLRTGVLVNGDLLRVTRQLGVVHVCVPPTSLSSGQLEVYLALRGDRVPADQAEAAARQLTR
jgi:hypothetical protein